MTMTESQDTRTPRRRTLSEAWPFGVLAIVTLIVLSSLTALGALAFNSWHQRDWDSVAVLALSAATVGAIPVPTFLVLRQLTKTPHQDDDHRSRTQ